MVDVKRQDLRTFSVLGTTTNQNVGEDGVGSAAEGVPENHRRYVWYVKAEDPDSNVIGTIYESLAGVLTVKDQFILTNLDKKQHPEGTPDPTKPVFFARGSGFIAVQTSSPGSVGSGRVLMTFGYYDALPQ